jgi:hypothetical protein
VGVFQVALEVKRAAEGMSIFNQGSNLSFIFVLESTPYKNGRIRADEVVKLLSSLLHQTQHKLHHFLVISKVEYLTTVESVILAVFIKTDLLLASIFNLPHKLFK